MCERCDARGNECGAKEDCADGGELEFTIPMKVKWIPFGKCDECKKRKLSTVFYEVHDAGLNAHIDYNVCKKCMKIARAKAKEDV